MSERFFDNHYQTKARGIIECRGAVNKKDAVVVFDDEIESGGLP